MKRTALLLCLFLYLILQAPCYCHADPYFATLESFGAVVNDKKDDTAAIQAAIDRVSQTGALLMARAGVYRHSGLQWKSNVRLRGAGAKLTKFLFTGKNGAAIVLPQTTNNAEMSHFKLDAAPRSTGWAIRGPNSGIREFQIDSFEIEGFRGGIDIHGGINIKIGLGRINGLGRDVEGGIGIKLGDLSKSGLRTTISTIHGAYISLMETCVEFDGGQGNLLIRSTCENIKTGIKNRGFNSGISLYFSEVVGAVLYNSSGFTLLHPTIYDLKGTRIEDPLAAGRILFADESAKKRTLIILHGGIYSTRIGNL